MAENKLEMPFLSKTFTRMIDSLFLVITTMLSSVPTVAPVPGANDTTAPSDADKGHPVNEMSLDEIPELGNGGKGRSVEQGSNNRNGL